MVEQTKQDYILEQKKSEAQANVIRVVNQKKADKAMDVSMIARHFIDNTSSVTGLCKLQN